MQLSSLMSKTILWSNQRKPNCLPCIHSAISRCFQPVGWLARNWQSLHQASTNTLYISRHEDRPLLVFMSALCRLTYLRDEEMKHWHRHHFLVDEYIGHFNSCSDQVHYIDVHTLGFLPGVTTGMAEYRTKIMTILSKLRLTSKYFWRGILLSGSTTTSKKIPKAKILTFCIRWLEFNVKYD